jgi:hypothetical protein
MVSAEERLGELEVKLPPPPVPLGAYVGAVRPGNLLFLSGALPLELGTPKFIGRLAESVSVDQGRLACRLVSSLPAGVCAVVELTLEVGA